MFSNRTKRISRLTLINSLVVEDFQLIPATLKRYAFLIEAYREVFKPEDFRQINDNYLVKS